ncbi:MAG: hypothetical protein GWP36_03845 [Bacteroidetes bacterium]|nr:hypothetical protein [Bacteroidota bacterium]
MLTAMLLGHRFSIVTMWQQWRHLYEKTIRDLGIGHLVASIRSIDVAPDNQNLMRGKESSIFPLLEAEARQAIDQDGADVILLGSTTMHQSHAYLCEKLEVPVINPGPLSYKLVETMLGLNLSHSRKAYPSSAIPNDAVITQMMAAAANLKP